MPEQESSVGVAPGAMLAPKEPLTTTERYTHDLKGDAIRDDAFGDDDAGLRVRSTSNHTLGIRLRLPCRVHANAVIILSPCFGTCTQEHVMQHHIKAQVDH